jgi:hypothetical protein
MLGRRDRDDAVDETALEPGQHPGPRRLRQRWRAGDVEGQLDAGVGGVHALTSGAGGPGEALGELSIGDDD